MSSNKFTYFDQLATYLPEQQLRCSLHFHQLSILQPSCPVSAFPHKHPTAILFCIRFPCGCLAPLPCLALGAVPSFSWLASRPACLGLLERWVGNSVGRRTHMGVFCHMASHTRTHMGGRQMVTCHVHFMDEHEHGHGDMALAWPGEGEGRQRKRKREAGCAGAKQPCHVSQPLTAYKRTPRSCPTFFDLLLLYLPPSALLNSPLLFATHLPNATSHLQLSTWASRLSSTSPGRALRSRSMAAATSLPLAP